MKHYSWAILIIFAFVACNKNKDQESEEDLSPAVSSKVTKLFLASRAGIKTDYTFKYDQDRVIRCGQNDAYRVVYDGSGRIDSVNAVNGYSIADYTFENNRLTKVFESEGSGRFGVSVTSNYYYNGDLVDSISRTFNSSFKSIYNMKMKYDDKKNLVEVKIYSNVLHNLFQVVQFEYTNELNPLRKFTHNFAAFHVFFADDDEYLSSNTMAPMPSYIDGAYRLKSSKVIYYTPTPTGAVTSEIFKKYNYVLGAGGKILKILRDGGPFLTYGYEE